MVLIMEHNKNNHKKRLSTIIIIEVIIAVVLLASLKIFTVLGKINHDSSKDNEIQKNAVEIKGYRNIVVYGVDSRQNALEKSTNSDVIIIASINNKTKDVKLVSVYRDTYVKVPDRDYNKINSAYFRGGYSLGLSTINTNFDLNVKEYVTVNFQAVVNTIDMLGGITLTITPEELHYLNGYVKELNRINGTNVPGLKSAGTQLVNGTQATAYSRIRYTAGGDYKRTERQRIVIGKIFTKVKASNYKTIKKFIDEVFPQIYTNMTSTELIGLASDVMSYQITDQTGFPFDKDAHTYNNVSYVFPINLEANVIKLHEFLFNKTGYVPTQTVKDISAYIEQIRVKK